MAKVMENMDTTSDSFLVIIGSYARGTLTEKSDIDVFRLNNENSLENFIHTPKNNPVVYIDFDKKTFNKMYSEGSLFLFHVFKEGILLEGDKNHWANLKKNFIVSNDFTNEISEYEHVLNYLCQYPKYEESYIPFLSNMFKVLKNLSIFYLASRGEYEFDKAKVLQKYYGFTQHDSRLLIESNNSFERGKKLSLKEKQEMQTFAKKIKNKYNLCKENI